MCQPFHLVGNHYKKFKTSEEQGFSTTLEPLLKEIHGGKGPTLGFFSGYPIHPK